MMAHHAEFHDAILAAYMRHEKRLGGPDMAKEAIQAAAEDLDITYTEVFDVVLRSRLMAGYMGR